jgi:hypothetical protein
MTYLCKQPLILHLRGSYRAAFEPNAAKKIRRGLLFGTAAANTP